MPRPFAVLCSFSFVAYLAYSGTTRYFFSFLGKEVMPWLLRHL